MIVLANKEIYRLDIKVGVSGDSQAKSKLSAMDRMTQQIEKKTKVLSKLTASPTAKLNDQASNKMDKINSKIDKFKSANVTVTAKLKDEASAKVDKIESKTKKIKEAKVDVKAIDKASGTIDKIQGKISGWIKAGAKKVIALGTAGVIAAGGIGIGTSIKTYSEYEKGLSNVKAVTNATDSQMKQLDASAKKFGSTTAWSARHVTEAEELLGQAGFSVDETISALPGLLNLASAGDLDLAAATDIASGTLKAFSLKASDASHVADVLALSASATNSDVTDLGEAMKYCAPVSQSLGISLEDTAAAVGLLSNANIKGSQSGTVLRQTMARLASPTDEAAKVMKKYGINAFDTKGNMKPLSGVVDNLNSSLKKLTSQQRADVISTIFGTESMSGVLALMNQGGKSVSDLSEQLKTANGAAQQMADTKLDNLNGQWIKLKAAVEHMQITLGEKLAPYAKEFVTWLTGKMPTITDKVVEMVDYISKHTNEIKSLAETVIGLGAAFTVLSTVGNIGNTISGISTLVNTLKGAKVVAETAEVADGISKIGIAGKLLPFLFSPAGVAVAASIGLIGAAVVANNDLMQKSITTTTEELGPMEKIMNTLNGGLLKSKKELVDNGLIYDDFGETVSDSFKKAAEDSSKNLLKLDMNLNKLLGDGVFNETKNNQLKNWFNDMAYEGINAMKEKQSEIQSEFQKTFSLDGVTSTAEQGTLDYINSYYEDGVNKELTIRDEMYKIGDDAIKNHGKILDSDLQLLKEKAAELEKIKLEYANAQNAGEKEYLDNKFKRSAEQVSGLNGASDVLKERIKEYDDTKEKIQKDYDSTIGRNKYLLKNETDPKKKAVLQKTIDETTSARDKALGEVDKSKDSDLATLYKNYSGAKGELNERTGDILSAEDKTAQKGISFLKNNFKNIDQITKEGWYRVKNTSSGEMEDIYATIDKKTGDIAGVFSKTKGWYGGYTNELKQEVKARAESSESNRLDNNRSLDILNGSKLSGNQLIGSNGNLIGELKEIKTATDGTVTGIVDVNNHPIQIISNVDGTITSMHQLEDSINKMDGRTIQITTVLSGAASSIGTNSVNSAIKAASEIVKSVPQHYAGTDNAPSGINSVGERGMELVLGRKLYNFKGGEKVLNNKETTNLLKSKDNQNDEPFQVKQGQYQLVKPQQVQVAGGGNSVQVDVQINNSNQDIEGIICEVTQEVGRKLRDAYTNIKK
ncbi:phage tail tape measure protein [Clostridium saccharoperbutylacetonicum]|uniref:phage tail tape measure protein n=1 Tax=Clostridium saccharoperbutylacetonicum TaxID=36745 RepID=UPI000983BE29|nr:phage tail tape measure protein [Clostridium saccharoperbutylacetonicum]AQR95569.1 phage-related minor tail protein [Clostridium saccharoperbutylacetonicum]NSB31429.1 TP901 family phage tail tape measure protein [Clostridium saccharoperbutylacetonicum]